MKKYLKYAITAAVAAVFLIAMGWLTLSWQSEICSKRAAFDRTDFEYSVVSPSAEQVAAFRASPSVKAVTPCRAIETKLAAATSSQLFVLFADADDEENVGLFNERTVTKGDFFAEGIQLDATAAKKLHASVGDSVVVELMGRGIEMKVAAVHAPCAYPSYDDGLAFARWTESVSALYTRSIPYAVAFVDVADEAGFAALTKDYVPMGQIKSEADFAAEYKAQYRPSPNQTEEEWDAAVHNAYEAYKERFLSLYEGQTAKGLISSKAILRADAEADLVSLNERVSRATIVAAVVSAVALAVIFCLYLFLDAGRDRGDVMNGVEAGRIALLNFLACFLCIFCAALLATGTLLVVAAAMGQFGALVPFALKIGLPVLTAALPVALCDVAILCLLLRGRRL